MWEISSMQKQKQTKKLTQVYRNVGMGEQTFELQLQFFSFKICWKNKQQLPLKRKKKEKERK